MTVRLEPLRHRDLARCAELEAILFAGDDPWSEGALHGELNAGHYYLGAHDDAQGGQLVGYAGMSLYGTRRNSEANVHTIGVDPDRQGEGIGRLLLTALLARADEFAAPVYLEVRTDNTAAIGLYEAHGFTRVGLRPRYYQQSGADAYTMARPARVSEDA